MPRAPAPPGLPMATAHSLAADLSNLGRLPGGPRPGSDHPGHPAAGPGPRPPALAIACGVPNLLTDRDMHAARRPVCGLDHGLGGLRAGSSWPGTQTSWGRG
jgi:hypothetical protein